MMKTLYRYELKKLLSQKILWIAAGIMLLLLLAVGATNLLTGNASKATPYKQISGRAIDDMLIEEMQNAVNAKQDGAYRVIHSFVAYCMGREDYGTVDATQVYAARTASNEKELEKSNLSEAEKNYWNKKEARVSKPFVYQYEEGYAGLFTTIYVANYMLLLLIAIGASGIFADEKNLGIDQIIFCSAEKDTLFKAKVLAGLTLGLGASLLLFGVISMISFGTYGFDGFDAPLQIRITGCMMNLSIGQADLILLGLFVAVGLLYSIIAMFLSQISGNHAAVTAVMVVMLFLSMLNVPEKFRVISQIWSYLPGAFIGSWTFTEYRLVHLFGQYFNDLQVAPAAWLLVGIVLLLFAKTSYRRYQVLGK